MSGNTASRPQHTHYGSVSRSYSDAISFSHMMGESASFANEIRIQKGVWKHWKDFNDKFEYYTYRGHMHKAICIRRLDTGEALKIDIYVDKTKDSEQDQPRSKWHVRVRKADWKPEGREVKLSNHTWHAAAALKALHLFVPKFGKWEIFTNNCFTFVRELIGSMVNDERRQEAECEPITDLEEFVEFAETLGVEVCFMKREEIDKLAEDDDVRMAEGGDSGVDTDTEEHVATGQYTAIEEQNNGEEQASLVV